MQRARLRRLATLFLLEKHFTGAHGFKVNDLMRVCIAAKACVPILELDLSYYANFKGIVVYADDFLVREQHMDEAGVVHDEVRDLCGQALSHGPVVLSWQTIVDERVDIGKDVVIHECAHKIDMLNGPADGFPPLHAGMSTAQWTTTMRSAYDDFCHQVDHGAATRLDPYAAEDAAEFFSVLSETFFTRPDIVREDFPAVYNQLALFYRQRP